MFLVFVFCCYAIMVYFVHLKYHWGQVKSHYSPSPVDMIYFSFNALFILYSPSDIAPPVLIRQIMYRIIFHCFPLLCQRIIYYRVEYYFHLLRSPPEDLCNNLNLMQIRKRFDHLSALPQSISVIFHLYSLVVLYWQNSLPNRHLYSILYLNSYFSKSNNFYYHDLSCIFPVLF